MDQDEKNVGEDIINEKEELTLNEFCSLCGLDEALVIEMVDIGIIHPKGWDRTSWQFSLLHIARIKKAQKMQFELKLNLQGVALSLELLDELKELRRHIRNLEYQLKLLG